MKDHGFLRVSAISPRVSVGDPHDNAKAIADAAHAASAEGSAIALFPELCISGASCGDLFSSDALCDSVLEALAFLREESSKIACAIVVGLPLRLNARLYNCAVLLQGGCIRGIVPKTLSPSDPQSRWFCSAPGFGARADSVSLLGETVPFGNIVFKDGLGRAFGIEIGSDSQLGFPPSQSLVMSGAALILRPSARACSGTFYETLIEEIEADSRRYRCAILYAGAGHGESTSEAVFGGECLV
ncbi:MAG TPA: nitrilase-related carbon-nitrogen hydrolase, partial [Bacillota bacterium]|nr:nitrilase-related carbon-nitrogen hydrolase [Bacillota bacterium]